MNILTKAASLLGEARAAYDAPLLQKELGYTPPPVRFSGDSPLRWLGTSGNDLATTGYANHGTAYSVINRILAACQPLPWAVYALDGADGKAKPQPKHPLAALLYRPNPRQSWPDLKTELQGGLQLHGEVFLRRVRPRLGTERVKGKTSELWVMPGPCVELLPLGVPLGLFDLPTGYRYTDPTTGRWVDYPVEEVLHLRYWNPTNPHRGLSPVQAGADALTAAKAGLVSRVRQYQNQGPPGILFDEKAAEPWTAAQTGNVRRWLRSFFGGGRNFGEVPITGGKLGYLNMGMSPVDLDVLAAIPHDKDAVADLFRFPGQLLNGSRGTTFANMSEARKALYSDCVQPLEAKVRDELNRWLGPEYGDAVYLDFDLSGVPELQEDKKQLSEWLATAYWVKVVDKQRMVGVAADWKGPDYLVPMTLGDPLAAPAAVEDDVPVAEGQEN